MADGAIWPGAKVCVLEAPCGHPGCEWVPILSVVDGQLRAARTALDKAAGLYDRHHGLGPVLFHCGAGIERSPLVVAYILVTRHGMTWEAAYSLLRSRRPQVQDRSVWFADSHV
jgi:protein-tyrosine phosphatase